LVDEGFVERGDLDRRTNYYALSETGREALVERREWEDQFLEQVE
jgi:DNA-binding PadR family transcriptional regulator